MRRDWHGLMQEAVVLDSGTKPRANDNGFNDTDNNEHEFIA